MQGEVGTVYQITAHRSTLIMFTNLTFLKWIPWEITLSQKYYIHLSQAPEVKTFFMLNSAAHEICPAIIY